MKPKKCIIFDTDGTLADVRHRLHFLHREPKDWVGFHDALIDDKPIEAVVWLTQMLSAAANEMAEGEQFAILLVTARHESYRELSERWYLENDVRYDRIYMRANDDRRPDHEVKADILEQVLADGFEPILVVDDRPEVCDMWRSFGITVLQCEYAELVSRYAGKVLLTLLVGPAGAGKSTFATKNYAAGEIISTDRIREENGLGHDPDHLALTYQLARGYAKTRIGAGLRSVIDATNLKRKDRLAFARLVPKGALIEYVLIDRDYDEKVASRGWRPVELIDKHHRTFRDMTLVDVKTTDGLGNVIVIDKRTKR